MIQKDIHSWYIIVEYNHVYKKKMCMYAFACMYVSRFLEKIDVEECQWNLWMVEFWMILNL